ncbi:hypothetical protein PoB_003720200 [Plakobranchus ocellatus]|uniref:Uncharacterized protein n=1 Tax=Plakobranchus ocellatus TaxID=259542 RepID=A0AAV4AUR4_9GAST|nr:hypothetical protein PoB_003720200 [Plakobranchus ocellatus]
MFANRRTSNIVDVKLLPSGRLVLADCGNICMKLLNTQGQHLHTLKCKSNPCRLAVLDSSSTSSCFILAVTLPGSSSIAILEVSNNIMKIKVTSSKTDVLTLNILRYPVLKLSMLT